MASEDKTRVYTVRYTAVHTVTVRAVSKEQAERLGSLHLPPNNMTNLLWDRKRVSL